jgi:putative glutathione S-transferase
MLVEGKWTDRWYDTKSTGGKFVRGQTQFRDMVSADPDAEFPAQAGRYHLYISLACPWAHRTVIMRKLKKLEEIISLSIVHPFMGKNGWTFEKGPGVIPDEVNGCQYLYQVYLKARSDYTGLVTVPVLWDKRKGTIVNNESAQIIRMFNGAFNRITGSSLDFYPEDIRGQIDRINEMVYRDVNDGVYKAGFATSQQAYEEAFINLFQTLDELEDILSRQSYLCGDRVSEADIRLFTTLVRFDPVYYTHFKCNLRRIADYPNLYNYLKALYQIPSVANSCDFDHIKQHYYTSHDKINPTRIVPKGPEIRLHEPHDRPIVQLG